MTDDLTPIDHIPSLNSSAIRARLTVVDGTHVGMKMDCRRLVTLIGARAGCKLVLNHAEVAPIHLALVNHGTHLTAVDLVTANGTELNGLPLEQEQISDGDTLTIGPWEFRVALAQPQVAEGGSVEPIDLEPTPQVVALEHVESGRLLQPNREVCILGRRKGCDVFIESHRVSRVHALLIKHLGHPAIVDLLSKQHTLVNGEPVAFRVLKNNDVVAIGGASFRVRTMDSGVVKSSSGDPSASDALRIIPLPRAAESTTEDQIDIEDVEGSQPWRIVDSFNREKKQA